MSKVWRDWCDLEDSCDHVGPAVYQIRICGHRTPRSIGRLLRSDTAGILCIGMTDNMRRRYRAFVRGLNRGRGHSEANLLHRLETFTALKRLMPRRIYQYRFLPVLNRADAQMLEERLIKDYVKRFGEVPPLNSAIPNRYRENGW